MMVWPEIHLSILNVFDSSDSELQSILWWINFLYEKEKNQRFRNAEFKIPSKEKTTTFWTHSNIVSIDEKRK